MTTLNSLQNDKDFQEFAGVVIPRIVDFMRDRQLDDSEKHAGDYEEIGRRTEIYHALISDFQKMVKPRRDVTPRTATRTKLNNVHH